MKKIVTDQEYKKLNKSTPLNIKSETVYIQDMLQRTGLFFSQSEIEKIRNKTFAIAGLGGVGAITAELLARWGVKKFRLLDKDRYESSNMNRQLFAVPKTLNRLKVEVAAERIHEINPFADIEMLIPESTNNENVPKFIQGADMVIQTTDHPSSLLLYKAARLYKVPLINGHATITGCRVTVYDFRTSQCYKWVEKIKDRIKWRKKKQITEMTPEELDQFDQKWVHPTAASLNFVTNIVGCLVISEAIKLISGRGKTWHYPKQIDFNLFNLKFRKKNIYSFWNIANYKRLLRFFKLGDKSGLPRSNP